MTDLPERWYHASKDWVDKEAAADTLKESKSSVFSMYVMRLVETTPKLSVARAEHEVRASEEWRQYIKEMVEAARVAHLAKAHVDYLRMNFSKWISMDANDRQGARIA